MRCFLAHLSVGDLSVVEITLRFRPLASIAFHNVLESSNVWGMQRGAVQCCGAVLVWDATLQNASRSGLVLGARHGLKVDFD